MELLDEIDISSEAFPTKKGDRTLLENMSMAS